MNNGTINNEQVTRRIGGSVIQPTFLNLAQETLQQLLASNLLTGNEPFPVMYKQGDIEKRAIELAEAVGSAFTALDCLPGRLSDLQSRAINTEELSLKLARTVATLLDRITGTSLGGDFADTRPVPSNQIGRTHTAVRRTEGYLNEALHMLDEINKVIDKPFIIKGGDVTADEVAAVKEFNRVMGMDGRYNWQNITAYDHHLKFLIPTVEDVGDIFNEVLSEVREWKLTSNNTGSLLNEIHNRVLKRISMTLKFIGE
ncbi:hypothetical protein [Yersinia enterocolitica]|uniref:hypothetical protein n=1 Tax=Yersinia enterocolitica TaxID=630 RepID=UPI00398D060B